MTKGKIKPLDVVKVMIRLQNFDEDCGDVITNLKAQKLAYYVQGLSYAILGEPMFEEDFEAWMYGPVIPELYDQLKEFGSSQIKLDNTDDDDTMFTDKQLDVIIRVYNTFGQYSAWKLRDMTHEEKPWKDTKRGTTIDKELIKGYFIERFAKAI